MIDICVHMMVRNGEDCVKQSLISVLPYVKKVIVCLDSRSSDGTWQILQELTQKFSNLIIYPFEVKNPVIDLVRMRNFMIAGSLERFCWIVDSDEVYPKSIIEKLPQYLRHNGVLAYGFKSWTIWDKDRAHGSTSNRPTMRIFRNFKGLEWVETFGREKLMLGDINLCYDYWLLPYRYIHYTLLKSDDWRQELGYVRTVDDRKLVELPEDIKLIVKDYVEKKSL